MELLSRLLEVIGFGIGVPVGLLLGYFLFMHPEPCEVKVMPS